MDGCLPSRFVNEIPDENIEKNEVGASEEVEPDFEFNQDLREILPLKKKHKNVFF